MSAVHTSEWFAEAFKISVNPVPDQLRTLSEKLCRVFDIKGICDPVYIANVSALELGMGNGTGQFHSRISDNNLPTDIQRLSQRLVRCYSSCIRDEEAALNVIMSEVMAQSIPGNTGSICATLPRVPSNIAPTRRSMVDKALVDEMIRKLKQCQAQDRLIDLSMSVMVEAYGRSSDIGTFAIQFMAVVPTGNPAMNIATFIPDLGLKRGTQLTLQKPGGRVYWNPAAHCEDIRDLVCQCILDEFAQSELEAVAALPGGAQDEKPVSWEARYELVDRLLEQNGVVGLLEKLSASHHQEQELVPGPAQ